MNRSNWLKEKQKIDSRVHWMIQNGLNHWAGTISPAPKSIDHNEIESLREGIDYYRPYCDELILQPKFMGSYCAIYLNSDHSKTKFFSRNGYLIKHLNQDELLHASKELHSILFKNKTNIDTIIVESELMPWRILGTNLIDREFGNYYRLHKDFMNYIDPLNSDIHSKMMKLRITDLYKQYKLDPSKLKPHEKRQMSGVDIYFNTFKVITDYEDNLNLFKRQLDEYGKEDDLHFEPFNIVKYIYNDGSENIIQSNLSFTLINDHETCILKLNDPDIYNKAYNYYFSILEKNMEGIMIKPVQSNLINIPHGLKVRTNDYLQLIYGIDFNRNLDYYLKKRNTKWKMRQAIQDYELHCQLIRIKEKDLHENNKHYKNLLYKVIDGEKFNKTLDGRL